jgi:hypothetical protein
MLSCDFVFPKTRKYRYRDGWVAALSLSVLILVLTVLSDKGERNRRIAVSPLYAGVSMMADALKLWESQGMRGRVLVLFDRRLNADSTGGADLPASMLRETAENYVYVAYRKNIVRKVYHVIPDASWSDVEHKLTGNPYVERRGGGFRLTIEGMPVHIQRLQGLPVIDEPVLLIINQDLWDNGVLRHVARLMKSGVLRSDIVLVAGRAPEEILQVLH